MSRRSWLLSLISLMILLSLLSTGCTEKGGPSEQSSVMTGPRDEVYFPSYRSGFNSGANEGYSEASDAEPYSPSLKLNLNGGYRRSFAYWKGYNDGYNYGWNRYKRLQKPGYPWYRVATLEANDNANQAVVGYIRGEVDEKENAYMSGYNVGRKKALEDSKAGSDYTEDPSSMTIESYCSDESQTYREGWIKGYREGYRDNYNIEAYKRGYEAGKKQALADSKGGRVYNGNPSDKAVEAGCSGKSQDYSEIWIAGYKAGYDDYWSTSEEGTAYQAGFEEGYKKGLQAGMMDRQSGLPFNDKPYNMPSGMDEDYQRGVEDGYSKGYKEGYEKGQQ